MLKSYFQKSERGFTLVEMMIVVAIIGILSSVSSVYFSHYQAKSRSSEAKMILASVYTSEEIFYQEYAIYSNCLGDMGFEMPNGNKSFYAVGFPSITANIAVLPYGDALDNGLTPGICDRNLAPTPNQSYYLATIGVGDSVMNTIGEFRGAVTSSSSSLDEGSATNTGTTDEGLGDQTSLDTQVFSAVAAGYVHIDFNTPATSSAMKINHLKELRPIRQGF